MFGLVDRVVRNYAMIMTDIRKRLALCTYDNVTETLHSYSNYNLILLFSTTRNHLTLPSEFDLYLTLILRVGLMFRLSKGALINM